MSVPPGRSERIAGVALALLGVAVAAEATTFEVAFLTDPVGPKALPYLSAFIFVVAGVVMAARPGAVAPWPPRPVLLRMAAAVGAFAAYALLLAPVGFVASTTAVVGTLSVLFGARPLHAFSAAFALAVVMWYGFVFALGLPLPLGAVWRL